MSVQQKPEVSRLVYGPIVHTFARGYFGVATSYWVKTDPGIGVYMSAVPQGYANGAALVPGIVETWWYPLDLFVVFRAPAPGETIRFQNGDPLCVLLPAICDEVVAEELTDDEYRERLPARERYNEYWDPAKHPKMQWDSAEGERFSRRYRLFSKENAVPYHGVCTHGVKPPDSYAGR